MSWLRAIPFLFTLLAFVLQPANASALGSAHPEARVSAFELVALASVGASAETSPGLHEGIGRAYDENASGYRFASGGGSVGAMKLVSFGANAGTKLRKHSQHIRETARRLGVEIPKGPGRPETRAAMENFITRVAAEGNTVTGRYMSVAEAQWSRLGDAIVVRGMDGQFITFLDATKGGIARAIPGGL